MLEHRLSQLVGRADDGYYWMVGHRSGQWYRHDGQRWLPDDPHRVLEPSPSKTNVDEVELDAEQLAQESVFALLLIILLGLIIYWSAS